MVGSRVIFDEGKQEYPKKNPWVELRWIKTLPTTNNATVASGSEQVWLHHWDYHEFDLRENTKLISIWMVAQLDSLWNWDKQVLIITNGAMTEVGAEEVNLSKLKMRNRLDEVTAPV